ncbi:alpha/beta fold hydrolase [Undibacterium sp. TJN19]|uniref:alpha/beta fold hydrolase n=1 Tax=Undibacterium sp. TJN19 TaxID=3413055 RepID=UPI003BF41EDB
MTIQSRNNVTVTGQGPVTMLLAHGFGCDKSMWRFLVPAFQDRFKIITFDSVGSGGSDLSAYDRKKYASLQGYADDVLDILADFADGPVIFVGHSVSAMVGLLASIKAPELFTAQIMVGPSPCYINDDSYVGGFSREDIDDLLDTMDSNYLGWSSNMAPAIMGAPDQPDLGMELTNSFCRTDPDIAKHFARVTFLSDHRNDLALSTVPALILQCSDDLVAPREVGEFMHRKMPNSTLHIIQNVGHCPHMSAPTESSIAIEAFLKAILKVSS